MTIVDHAEKLIDWLSAKYLIPDPGKIMIVEENNEVVAGGGKPKLRKDKITSIDQYIPRFTEISKYVYSWINLSCAGIFRGQLIFTIRMPSTVSNATETPINYSGPMNAVADDPKWDIETKKIVNYVYREN